jgi:predicted metal-dependent HD superfamily phosphohydrolase
MIALPDPILDDLKTRYAEPARAYHNWHHIEALLRWMRSDEFALHNEIAVHHAILFHDAIYDPISKDNEEQSALLAEDVLMPLADAAHVLQVCNMIRATAKHVMWPCSDAEAEKDMAHFLDMDLSILGADWPVFEIYEENIRKEYSIYPDAMFWPGRAAVLQAFVARDRLYFSDWGYGRFEAKARANLAKAIDLAKSKMA